MQYEVPLVDSKTENIVDITVSFVYFVRRCCKMYKLYVRFSKLLIMNSSLFLVLDELSSDSFWRKRLDVLHLGRITLYDSWDVVVFVPGGGCDV